MVFLPESRTGDRRSQSPNVAGGENVARVVDKDRVVGLLCNKRHRTGAIRYLMVATMLKGKSRSDATLPLLGMAFTGQSHGCWSFMLYSPLLHRRREEDYLTGLTESARRLDVVVA